MKQKPSARRAEKQARNRREAQEKALQKEKDQVAVLEELGERELDDRSLSVLKALAESEDELNNPEEGVDEPETEGSDDEVSDPESPQDLKKHSYYSEFDSPSYGVGPTSFSELDTAREAEEKASEVRMAGWDVQDLVRNIIHHPNMEPAAKSKAITKVGTDFESRVSKLISKSAPVQKDMDVLVIESILARDARRTNVIGRIAEKISKTKPAVGNPVDFPLVDRIDVRRALLGVAEIISKGGEGAEDARAALPKIRDAAKEHGIEVSLEKDRNAILIQKDASGSWRWVGWASNNFMDWSGEIISKEAHTEYVGWLDANPDMAPLLMSWHEPGTAREAAADFWMYENSFLILSGPLTEGEAAGLLKAQSEIDLGMSVGGFAFADPAEPKVFKKYRLYEVSDLPLDNADNPFTDFAVLAKEADMDKQAYLANIFGSEDKATAFLEKTGLKEETLVAAGVTQKEKPTEEAKTTAPVNVTNVVSALPADQQALVQEVLKALDIEGLNEFVVKGQEAIEKVEILEKVVKAQQTSVEGQLADLIAPRFAWSKEVQKTRASQADATKVEADDPLAKAKPEKSWFSEATGTEAVDAEKVAA